MKISRIFIGALLAFVSSGCGGGDNSQGNSSSGNDGVQQCSILDRQNWSRNVIDEWYLFPNLIDNSVNPANFSSVQEYLDALVAPARAEDKDRGFTYITSASEEDELINSGSTAGFGIRLVVDSDNSRVFVSEAFENGPAFLAGMDRGQNYWPSGQQAPTCKRSPPYLHLGEPPQFSTHLALLNQGLPESYNFGLPKG